MITVAKTKYYEIEYNEPKNRVYYKIIGFWEDVEHVPLYLWHIKECLRLTKPDFTMLVDATQMEPHPPEIEDLRKQAQVLALAAGMKQAAEIVSQDFISSIQFDCMTETTGFQKGKFKSFTQADTWLDNFISVIKD